MIRSFKVSPSVCIRKVIIDRRFTVAYHDRPTHIDCKGQNITFSIENNHKVNWGETKILEKNLETNVFNLLGINFN